MSPHSKLWGITARLQQGTLPWYRGSKELRAVSLGKVSQRLPCLQLNCSRELVSPF